MATLTSSTVFTVEAAAEEYVETADIHIFPENAGSDAVREMHYPGDLYAVIQYDSNPDKWENFDSAPMTARTQMKSELTLSSVQMVSWRGYMQDRSIREIWSGSDSRSRMTAYFLRRLWEYFSDPPESGYIVWYPKDMTEQGYNIKLESVSVGGTDVITFMNGALQAGVIPWEVVVQFRIVSEA
jgi:hypothetical protein